MICFFIISIGIGQTKINGIGPFKIGNTPVSLINELSKEFGASVNETNDVVETNTNYLDENPTKILFLSKDKNEKVEYPHSNYINHSKVKVYFLNNFLIPEVVVLHNIFLNFYNDTLYSIECEGSDVLDTALTLKYGKPQKSITSRKITCSNAYRTFNYEETTYTKEWTNPLKKIEARLVYSTYYNSKCEEKSLTYFLLYNEVVDAKIIDQVEKNKKQKEAQNILEKKSKLSDF